MKFILGKKLNMTQIFLDNGKVVPVTIVEAGPCQITQIKTFEKDGYPAVQIGFGKKKKLLKPALGHLKDLPRYRYLKEFRVDETEGLKKGKEITVKMFQTGDKVKVTGTSKGKGFQGVVKRHGFHGSPASHGHKDQLRMPGSIGATEPARVFKGKKMPGRIGGNGVTVANLEVIQVDPEKNYLYIKGAVPGARNGLVLVQGPGELKEVEEKPEEKLKEPKNQEPKDKKESEEKSSSPKASNDKGESKEENVKSNSTLEENK